LESKKIDVTQKMLEQALLCCASDDPAPDRHEPCENCYLQQLHLVRDGHMSTGETCFMHLALDAIDFIRRINDFDSSQSKIMLEKLEQVKVENTQLHAVITQKDPEFFKRKCRVCGCNWNHACPGGCCWVEDDLCNACAEQGLGGKR
jgi:hypothetical protein